METIVPTSHKTDSDNDFLGGRVYLNGCYKPDVIVIQCLPKHTIPWESNDDTKP